MLRHSSNDENIFATAVQLTSYWRRQMTYIFFSVQHFSRSALRMLFLISICMKKKWDGVSFGVNFCIFQFDRIQKAWEQTYSNHIMQCLASSNQLEAKQQQQQPKSLEYLWKVCVAHGTQPRMMPYRRCCFAQKLPVIVEYC